MSTDNHKKFSKTRSETLRTVFAAVSALASLATLIVVIVRQ